MTEDELREIELPKWRDDPFYWTFFVPDSIRDQWPRLDAQTKSAVYITAERASRHLRETGVFDS